MDRFKFALLWENNVDRSGLVPRDRLLEEFVPFWFKTYFRHPSYLIVNGKPVLYIYDTPGFISSLGGNDGAKESVRLMREAVRAAGFKGLWILGEYRGGEAAPFRAMEEIGFDAAFPYCYSLEGPKFNQDALDDIMALARKQDEVSKIPVVATVSASWDVQPWLEYIDYIWHDKPFWLTPTYFKKEVELMKARLDARPGNNPLAKRMLLVDNWNEYGEGHWVAPSRKEGFRYLNAIRDVFAPQTKDQPNVLLEDAGLRPDESRHEAWMEEIRAKLPAPK